MKSMAKRTILVWIILVLISLFFTGFSYARIDEGSILGMWLFDEEDTEIVEDVSGNGNDGNIFGSPEWDEGKFGTLAMVYDGIDDYVEIPNFSEQVKDGFTVTFWLSKINQDQDNRWLFGKYSGWSPGSTSFLIFKDEGNRNVLYFAIQGEKTGPASCTYSALEYEKWNHIATTYDKSVMKLYINGTQVATKAFTEKVSSSGEPWYIGFKPGNQIEGMMDEVALFNVALAEEDIKRIYEDGLGLATGIFTVSPAGKIAATWSSIRTGY
jgi:hypothetical protein